MKTPPNISTRYCGCGCKSPARPASPAPAKPAAVHTVTVSSEELVTLGLILRLVGGSPEYTLRRHAQALSRRLEEQTSLPYVGWAGPLTGDTWPSSDKLMEPRVGGFGAIIMTRGTQAFRDAVRKTEEGFVEKKVAELPKPLKAFTDMAMPAGFSWSGFVVEGTESSIKEVKRLVNAEVHLKSHLDYIHRSTQGFA